jgi:hypothetical protein
MRAGQDGRTVKRKDCCSNRPPIKAPERAAALACAKAGAAVIATDLDSEKARGVDRFDEGVSTLRLDVLDGDAIRLREINFGA